jgi:hypothetical protein
MTTAAQQQIILTLTPQQVKAALPIEPETIGQGFSDKTLTASGVDFSINYDGESELIAVVTRRAHGVSDQYCEDAIKDFFEFDIEEDEDEGE